MATKGYKALNKDLTCRDFQYKVDEEFTISGPIELCKRGFHFCENPIEVYRYYPLNSRVFEIESADYCKKSVDTSKVVTNSIKLIQEVDHTTIFNKSMEYIKTHNNDSEIKYITSDNNYIDEEFFYKTVGFQGRHKSLGIKGDYSIGVFEGIFSSYSLLGNASIVDSYSELSSISITGNNCKGILDGKQSSISIVGWAPELKIRGESCIGLTTGENSFIEVEGESSIGITNGDVSAVISNGVNSVGIALGERSRAKGSLGSWIILSEYSGEKLINIKSVKIDGIKVKEDRWYTLKNGKFIEV